MCFGLVFLQNTVLKCVSVVDFWNHATPYKQSGERIQISNICAYCVVYIQAGTCGISRILMPIDDNRWIATTFVWLSIDHRLADANRCQLTNKASIGIDWTIDFPIIGFIDCPCPVKMLNNNWLNVPVKSKLQHPPRAYPGHLLLFPAQEGGHLITTHRGQGIYHVTSHADSTWVDKS